MKVKDLISRLNILVQINPNADVYFYANDKTIEFIGKSILEEIDLF